MAPTAIVDAAVVVSFASVLGKDYAVVAAAFFAADSEHFGEQRRTAATHLTSRHPFPFLALVRTSALAFAIASAFVAVAVGSHSDVDHALFAAHTQIRQIDVLLVSN